MHTIYPILIIGGGAAGLMAALAAGRNGIRTILLEKGSEAGRKLSITGGGRGNLTNLSQNNSLEDPVCSRENADKMLRTLQEALTPADIRKLFLEIGVKTYVDDSGRVFPSSDKATDLRNALVREIERMGGKIQYQADVLNISDNDSWEVVTSTGKYFAQNVIIATGGASFPQTGSTGDSRNFFNSLEVENTAFLPALCPLILKNAFPTELEGISLEDAELSYSVMGKRKNILRRRRGPILWQRKGLSGPIVLNSTAEAYDEPTFVKDSLHLNFLPQHSKDDLKQLFRHYSESHPAQYSLRFMETLLPDRLAAYLWERICRENGISETLRLANVSNKQLELILKTVQHYNLQPALPPPIRIAMACRGGLSPSELNLRTMEIKKRPGLFAAGECIDFDFKTGGYHLTFAFQSGWLAGTTAALLAKSQ